MPENQYSRHNGRQSGEPSQVDKQLRGLDQDELIDELADCWDAMDAEDFDSALIDAYLARLDNMESTTHNFNAEASLAAFREKHSLLLEQAEPASTPSNIITRSKARHHWRTVRLIAAVVVVTLSCMVTAQALGYNLFGIIARWTEETFQFSAPASTETSSTPLGDAEYKDLQEALDAYGIAETIAPKWYPPEYVMSGIKISPASDKVTFQATYEAGEKFMAVTISKYDVGKEANNGIFEKDSSSVISYESGGIVHYLMSNEGQMTAAWTNQSLICSISGDLSENELKQMINSIYER